MKISVLTLFPQMFPGPLDHSLNGKWLNKKLWELNVINIRDFSHLKHNKVDDHPYGGGEGLILRYDIIDKALKHTIKSCKNPHIIYLSPKGKPLVQSDIKKYLDKKEIIFLCGRYEGIDERVIQAYSKSHGLEEISIGDYILSGGEIPAMAMIDAILRKKFLKNKKTLKEESFEVELLEYPQYTIPREYNKLSVPEILLSGHHLNILKWQKEKQIEITKKRRPDLWERYLGRK